MNQTSVSPEEINKFELMAEDWWSPTGKFKPLHDLTPLRLEYIINISKKHFDVDSLEGIDVLDIGCGGGIISEPMTRLKTKVTGIDASAININIAKEHALVSDLKINYQQILAEDLVKQHKNFQLILALEIIEHLDNVEFFIQTCCRLLKKDGLIIFSTMNKTLKSYLLSIVAAEYILRWLPKGTHDWSKFVKPSEINKYMIKEKGRLIDLTGMSYAPLSKSWNFTKDVSNNYFIAFTSSI